MQSAPLPADESSRLAAWTYYEILDTSPDEGLYLLEKMAPHIRETPIALFGLVDIPGLWFKTKVQIEPFLALRNGTCCILKSIAKRVFS